MIGLNPVHASLVILAVLCAFLIAYVVRAGIAEYLPRLILAYALFIEIWALSMLGATTAPTERARSLSSIASLVATFGVPPTALLVALYLLLQRPLARAAVALAYLPGLAFFVASAIDPRGAYSVELTSFGYIPFARSGGLAGPLNVAITALYVPAAFAIFFRTWLKPRNRRAKRQSALFILAALIGMASTAVMTALGMPLQYIPSLYSYVFFLYVAMRRYRLALDAPSFAKDRLWDHVREELILTDRRGSIISWNAKAASRFGLATDNARDIRSVFAGDAELEDYLAEGGEKSLSDLDRKLLRAAGNAEDLVTLTARRVYDSYGDVLGFIFLSSGSVPFRTMRDAYGITEKEWEVMCLLATGKEYRDIGETMFISPFTVKNHVHSAYQKLGVKNRYELVPLLFP